MQKNTQLNFGVQLGPAWCGLRTTNRATHSAQTRTLRVCLSAMSATLGFGKCYALAAPSACGLPRLVAREKSVIAKRGELAYQSERQSGGVRVVHNMHRATLLARKSL